MPFSTCMRLALVWSLLAACGDDDAGPDTDAGSDAGGEAGSPSPSVPDACTASCPGSLDSGTATPDAAVDAGNVTPDAGDPCPRVPFPHWPGFVDHPVADDPDAPFTATRIPFVPCTDSTCRDLEAFEDELECTDTEDGGVLDAIDDLDGGLGRNYGVWVRVAGCGYVQFGNVPPNWQRYYNFDATTGDLVGDAWFDDVVTDSGGCSDAAFVSGVVEPECSDAVVSVCIETP